MKRTTRCGMLVGFALAAWLVLPAPRGFAEEMEDQLGNRALQQKPPDWALALKHFLKAHAADPAGVERYRLIAGCLSNTSRPLAAISWYQLYRSSEGADPDKQVAVAKQVQLLRVDVRSKASALFSQARELAEKQIKEEASAGRLRATNDSLFRLPDMQASAGFLEEALATQKRVRALSLQREHDTRLPEDLNVGLAARYAFAVALAGDVVAAQGVTGFSEEETAFVQEARCLAELARHEMWADAEQKRIEVERLTASDPMENLDVFVAAALRNPDTVRIPVALSVAALDIGTALLRADALRPENRPERRTVSDGAWKYAYDRAINISTHGVGWFKTKLQYQRGVDEQILRGVSRFEISECQFTRDNEYWLPITWALKSGVDRNSLDLLEKCGLGVNARLVYRSENDNWVGSTPLHHAVMQNNPVAVELLLKYGADPSLKNKAGRTPLDIAKSRPVAPQLLERLEKATGSR